MNAILILFLLFKVACAKLDPIPDADDKLHVYALPVGQGDCTVIQCPKANLQDTKGLVTIIDAGSLNNVGIDAKGIEEFLAGTKINFVVLTHSDKDHYKYMNDVLKSYYEKVKEKVAVYHPCDWSSYRISEDYADPKKIPHCVGIADCKQQASELEVCPGVAKLSFVVSAYKECGSKDKAENEDSLVSKITFNTISALITGDFELKKDDDMKKFLNIAKQDLQSQIYKLSHHGSYGANPVPFLDAVGASYVFSSSGFRYGHPRCELYDHYYKNKLLDNTVDDHLYTCFNHIGSNKYNPNSFNTKKAIYVTSVYKPDFTHWTREYYIVKFNIDAGGNIGVELKQVLMN
uniref:Metallo-beta-lactamase domain-containing protein n=1 Tax=Amphimedon queenslandica TaxID=400682 RepID=A0A1X7STJ3_AMPQE